MDLELLDRPCPRRPSGRRRSCRAGSRRWACSGWTPARAARGRPSAEDDRRRVVGNVTCHPYSQEARGRSRRTREPAAAPVGAGLTVPAPSGTSRLHLDAMMPLSSIRVRDRRRFVVVVRTRCAEEARRGRPVHGRIRTSLFSRTVEEALFLGSRQGDMDTARPLVCATVTGRTHGRAARAPGRGRRGRTWSSCGSTRSAIPTRPARIAGRALPVIVTCRRQRRRRAVPRQRGGAARAAHGAPSTPAPSTSTSSRPRVRRRDPRPARAPHRPVAARLRGLPGATSRLAWTRWRRRAPTS